MKTKITFVNVNNGGYFARTKEFSSELELSNYTNEMLKLYGNKVVKIETLN